MISTAPLWLGIFFVFSTFLCLYLSFRFFQSSHLTRQYAFKISGVLLIWLILQAILTSKGVYSDDPTAFPPKIVIFSILPTVLFILTLFIVPKLRNAIFSFSLSSLVMLNVVRIPVEISLLYLYLNGLVPQIMTFEGRNFDIIAGITAPILAYYYVKGKNSKWSILWHVLCLALLINIVYIAILSSPTPMQKFGFEQPNIAIVQFPYSWLPSFIVPMVLFTHLASIFNLSKSRR